MIIYPAIDIRGGRCVRLTEGSFSEETVFSDDPVAMALKWENCGAEYLHLVDLDGALAGHGKNAETIKNILAAVRVPVQIGGGIRSMEDIDGWLDIGASRLILGSAAVKDPALVEAACSKYPGRIAVGIDAREGVAAVDGWERSGGISAVELARKMAGLGVEKIIFTDISRDGRLSGVNAAASAVLAQAAGVDVIASGGVASIADIEELKKYEGKGVIGCVIGKAIYMGAVDLRAAIACGREEGGC